MQFDQFWGQNENHIVQLNPVVVVLDLFMTPSRHQCFTCLLAIKVIGTLQMRLICHNVMCVSSFLYNALNICPCPTFPVIWHKEMAKFSVISGMWTRAQQVPSTRPLPNIFPSSVLKIIVNPEYWVLPDTSGIPDILEHCVYP